jgi:hypothetical protein
MEEKSTLLAKRKNIQTVFDYCLDQRISFTVNPRGLAADEFDITLTISGIKQAIALGMFAKEHKFEVLGLGELAKPKSANTVKKGEAKETVSKESEEVVETSTAKSEQQPTTTVLNF